MKHFFDSPTGTVFLTAAAGACAMLFPGVEIYLKNRDFFAISSWGALGFGILGFLIGFVPGAVVLFLLRKSRFFATATAVLLGGSIAVLLQYLIWSDFFPERAFGGILSPAMLTLTCCHLFVLLLPVLIATRFSSFCRRYAKELALIILLTQIVSVTTVFLKCQKPQYDFTEYAISEKTKFEFGRRENVIVLIVDAMGEQLCKETMNRFPELKKVFRDFTCFDRMVSPIPQTMYAVPAILTGIEYVQKEGPSDEDHAEYLNRVCHDPDSTFQRFKHCGFRTEGYPFLLQTISYRPDVIDNAALLTCQVQKHSAIRILDSALNRVVPFYLKPLLEEYYFLATDHFITPQDPEAAMPDGKPFDVAFYQKLDREFRVGARDKVFKYLHLHGAHDPLRTDEFLQENLATSTLLQLRGSLRIVELLLEKLKRSGLYDGSLIVVAGDHSELHTPENIAFIKRKGERHEHLRYHAVPCKVSDLAATILKESGAAPELKSLFDDPPVWGDGSCRKRSQISNGRFSPWRKVGTVNFEDLTFYPRSFHVENGRLLLETDDRPQESPSGLVMIVKNVKNGACRMSRFQPQGSRFSFLETPELAFGDGVYQVLVKKEHTWRSGEAVRFQTLPRFLLIRSGTYRWTAQYPEEPPRAMRPGETITFSAMRATPQIEFCRDSRFRNDTVTLGKEHFLKIHLPVLPDGADLVVTLKHPIGAEGVLSVRMDDGRPYENRTGETDGSVFVIHLPPGPEKWVKLVFDFVPKKLKRDASYNRFYFQIRRIQLK